MPLGVMVSQGRQGRHSAGGITALEAPKAEPVAGFA
jgi:hypothetical protein